MQDKIFISCSSKDTAAALTICEAIEARGYGCWIACRDVRAGQNFQEEIVQFIRAAPLMVLVFSANANDSNEIKKELAIASQYNLTVIPVRIDDVTPGGAFIYELATRQWIDLFGNWEKAMQTLVTQIAASLPARGDGQTVARTPLEPPPRPKPLPSGANQNLPWIAAGIAVLLLLVGGGVWLTRSGSSSRQPAVTPAAAPGPVAVPAPQTVTAPPPTPSASLAPERAAPAAPPTAKPAPATPTQPAPAAPGIPQPTLTCQFNSGPKSGYIQDFRGTNATPAIVGGSCTDGQGSNGLGIPDRPTQSTMTCQFFYGAKAGHIEDFRGTNAAPATVGGGCYDGLGSTGLGIPDRPAQSTLTCQFFYGPRAGQIQDFRGTNATPAIVGGPCTDGQGSNGLGIPNR